MIVCSVGCACRSLSWSTIVRPYTALRCSWRRRYFGLSLKTFTLRSRYALRFRFVAFRSLDWKNDQTFLRISVKQSPPPRNFNQFQINSRNRNDKITVIHSVTTHLFLKELRERGVYSFAARIAYQEVARIRRRNENALWIDFEETLDTFCYLFMDRFFFFGRFLFDILERIYLRTYTSQ